MTDFDEHMIPSKTARKREMDALQAVGKRLVELGDADLARIPINDEDLTEAIATAKRIKSREGLRRQMQYIGKLMRQVDTAAIEAALQELDLGQKALARRFHELEGLRDDMLSSELQAGVELAMQRFADADRQRLRQLLVQAAKERSNSKPPAAARKLFRYLRELQELANEDAAS